MMHTEGSKRTPLHQAHIKLGGKIVEFAGWELPVRYSSVIEEHKTVRERAGLFDICHMGEIFVTGPEAERALNYLTCNDVSTLTDGKALYNAILNPNGGVVDDIIVYRLSSERFLVCVNASNADKDFAWLQKHNTFKAEFVNRSEAYGLIALQGPKAPDILTAYAPQAEVGNIKYFHFKEANLAGADVIVARTGYTGEDGYEIFVPIEKTKELWEGLSKAGEPFGLAPTGLGARDSLRLEACYPLHGHELSEDISALESGLGWIVKFAKGDFIGRAALEKQKAQGVARALVGFFVDEAGIVREQTPLLDGEGRQIGVVTSGTLTPTLNRALGMALVQSGSAAVGTQVFALVRGRKIACHVVSKPFYHRGR